jgi:hypothetical protein
MLLGYLVWQSASFGWFSSVPFDSPRPCLRNHPYQPPLFDLLLIQVYNSTSTIYRTLFPNHKDHRQRHTRTFLTMAVIPSIRAAQPCVNWALPFCILTPNLSRLYILDLVTKPFVFRFTAIARQYTTPHATIWMCSETPYGHKKKRSRYPTFGPKALHHHS